MDLSNTGLTEPMMVHFGQALRRAKSLRSIHLCGNIGVTQSLVEYLTERTHGSKYTQINNIEFPGKINLNEATMLQYIQKAKLREQNLTQNVE